MSHEYHGLRVCVTRARPQPERSVTKPCPKDRNPDRRLRRPRPRRRAVARRRAGRLPDRNRLRAGGRCHRRPRRRAHLRRPRAARSFNPLIVHVADLDAARRIAAFNDTADRLAAGLLARRADAGPATAADRGHCTAGHARACRPSPSASARPPARPRSADAGPAGPSPPPRPTPRGKISPTTAAHVRAGLDGAIDAILDGGPCPVGLESTIVGVDPAADPAAPRRPARRGDRGLPRHRAAAPRAATP